MTPYLILFYNFSAGGSITSIAFALLGLMLVMITGARLCKELRISVWPLFLFPLGAVVMVMIMINSMMQVLIKGQTDWRGRKV